MTTVKTCRSCGGKYRPGVDPDPCIGMLPGVFQACCGHGRPHKAYVFFDNGVLIRGWRRIERHDLQRKRKVKS